MKDAAGFLFPPLSALEASLKTPETSPYERHLELSGKLCRSLAETAEHRLRALSGN